MGWHGWRVRGWELVGAPSRRPRDRPHRCPQVTGDVPLSGRRFAESTQRRRSRRPQTTVQGLSPGCSGASRWSHAESDRPMFMRPLYTKAGSRCKPSSRRTSSARDTWNGLINSDVDRDAVGTSTDGHIGGCWDSRVRPWSTIAGRLGTSGIRGRERKECEANRENREPRSGCSNHWPLSSLTPSRTFQTPSTRCMVTVSLSVSGAVGVAPTGCSSSRGRCSSCCSGTRPR